MDIKKVVVMIEKTNCENEKKAEACNSEESIWSNPKDKEANKAMEKAIDSLLNLMTNLDGVTLKPFVGNSTMKRIIKGITSFLLITIHLKLWTNS